MAAESTNAAPILFQVNNNHILSILIVLCVFLFLYKETTSLKSSLVLTFAFGLIHECLFSIFAVAKMEFTDNVMLGFDFLLIVGLYLAYSLFLKNTMLLRQYFGILVPYGVFLEIWYLEGFHLSHDVFTGQQTIYFNDPVIAVIEISSWGILAIAFCLSIYFFRKRHQK